MAITAEQVKKGSSYLNNSSNFKVTSTILEIIRTKAGRYKFVKNITWHNLESGKIDDQFNVKSTSAVSGSFSMFETEVK